MFCFRGEEFMAKYLVIVESPAKVNTIKKFLGANYEVMASNGHVRDLPKSQMGIGPENDFEPKYITIRGKGEILAKLRKEAKKADKIYLATDPDREGEAISWHLSQALNQDPKKMYRITFNEITKQAVKNSIKQAREIDMNLVDAQQTRRILDRMVGKDQKGLKCGACAVSSSSHHCRQRRRNRCLCAGRILVFGCTVKKWRLQKASVGKILRNRKRKNRNYK